MGKATYTTPDFLCVGPFCWGRAKTAREAFRQARANAADSLTKPETPYAIWRIADQTDEITVHDNGSWSQRAGCNSGGKAYSDPGKPLLVWKGDRRSKVKDIPELPTEEIAED